MSKPLGLNDNGNAEKLNDGGTRETMKVEYFHELKGVGHGNIIWAQRDRGDCYYRVSKYAMRAGKFPSNHPAAPNSKGLGNNRGECGDSEKLTSFRSRGYWASCFPEGDGITLNSENWDKPSAEVAKDIEEVFGWKVCVKRE